MVGETSCICLLSGGMDSACLLGLAKEQFDKVSALTLIYAQRHQREIESAKKVAKFYKVPHKVLDVSKINSLLQGSALTTPGIAVPKGHYAEESMKLTVVPARNTILLSLAAGYAISRNFKTVAYAAHAGDHTIYPDCRPEYVDAMREVFKLFHFWPMDIWTPFMFNTKGDIVGMGLAIGVPFELTWTCYDPQEVISPSKKSSEVFACGKCGSCCERAEAFIQNEIEDPVPYIDGWEKTKENVLQVLKVGASS
jgi:7-cyano-7-deazaguanine synthase